MAYDPERALAEVVAYTHYLPRAWRGRAHTAEVQVGEKHGRRRGGGYIHD